MFKDDWKVMWRIAALFIRPISDERKNTIGHR